MTDICCVGHITLDKIVTPNKVSYLPGGTAWYFSNAISYLPVNYRLITALAKSEKRFIDELERVGIDVQCFPSKHTLNFINIYPENQDHRIQKVIQQANPFSTDQLMQAKATITHLGSLVADDIPPALIKMLAAKTKVSLDVQGYLRRVKDEEVVPVQWKDAAETLPHVFYLKANEQEIEILTGFSDIYKGAESLAIAGVKEVIVTLGSRGSVILQDKTFYQIPAYQPEAVVDATGCGDTYMAGYLYKRVKGAGIFEAGRFGAAMATLNIEKSGAIAVAEEEVIQVIKQDFIVPPIPM
jgi:sugar/nucleoside kinase (ribokinase family)